MEVQFCGFCGSCCFYVSQSDIKLPLEIAAPPKLVGSLWFTFFLQALNLIKDSQILLAAFLFLLALKTLSDSANMFLGSAGGNY